MYVLPPSACTCTHLVAEWPAHEGIAGNEKADEWAKEAAGRPGAHKLLPRSLANLKREISEKKWA